MRFQAECGEEGLVAVVIIVSVVTVAFCWCQALMAFALRMTQMSPPKHNHLLIANSA